MFNELEKKEGVVNLEEKKELVSIDELSLEESEELENEFFAEHPEYKEVDEKFCELVKGTNLLKTSPFVKLLMFMGIGLAIASLFVLFKSDGNNPIFRLLIILAFCCLGLLVLASIIDSKKTDSKINKISEYEKSPEYQEYNKTRVEWYKNKGYTLSDEDDEGTEE